MRKVLPIVLALLMVVAVSVAAQAERTYPPMGVDSSEMVKTLQSMGFKAVAKGVGENRLTTLTSSELKATVEILGELANVRKVQLTYCLIKGDDYSNRKNFDVTKEVLRPFFSDGPEVAVALWFFSQTGGASQQAGIPLLLPVTPDAGEIEVDCKAIPSGTFVKLTAYKPNDTN